MPMIESIRRKYSDLEGPSPRKKISKLASKLAMDFVKAPLGKQYSVTTGTVFVLNMALGMGPLTLPIAFTKAGFVLTTVLLGVCAFLAYITATYTVETLCLENAMTFREGLDVLITEVTPSRFPHVNAMAHRTDKVFKLRERIELGEMGRRVLPKWLSTVMYVCVFFHTFGCLCVYMVTMTTTLLHFLLPLPTVCVVCILVVLLFPLCSADVQKLGSLNGVVMLMRLLVVVGLFAFARGIPTSYPPEIQWDGLGYVFGNCVMSFMIHHSVPGLLAPIEPQSRAPQAVWSAYLFAYVVYVLLAYSAISHYGNGVLPLYSMNFGHIPVLVAYPMLILAVYPVVAITLRNNVINAFGLEQLDMETPFALRNMRYTLAITCLPGAVATITDNVQAVVTIFAGTFGLSLMFFFPTILLYYARKMASVANVEGLDAFPLRSPFGHILIMGFVAAFWFCALIYTLVDIVNTYLISPT